MLSRKKFKLFTSPLYLYYFDRQNLSNPYKGCVDTNNPSNKRISLFTHDAEERVSIDDVDDIFKYADRLKSTVIGYLESPNNNHLSETK